MADKRGVHLEKLIEPLRVPAGATVVLPENYDPGYKPSSIDKQGAEDDLRMSTELLAEYQERLAAENTFGVLVVLQGIDASGKDGTIRHVMSGVNPQGVSVHSFKVPSEEELSHDFLWRYGRHLPERGQITIFNRSHYEEVMVVRVHPELLTPQRLPPAARRGNLWKQRYREINDWERYLVENGIRIVKLFLNLSWEEQRVRFLKRIDFPDKNWKFSASDIKEREYWDQYQQAYSEALTHTSTKWAPWYVIPADRKWFARIAVGAAIVRALIDIDPQYPKADSDEREALQQARLQLEAEAPKR